MVGYSIKLTIQHSLKWALDILAIPAMSAEVERVFSSASLTITDCRNQLGEEVIEAIVSKVMAAIWDH